MGQPFHTPDGKFAPGNQYGKLLSNPTARRVGELKRAWLDAVTDDKMRAIEDEIYRIATTDPDSRVRLVAANLYLERTLGKASQQVEIDARSGVVTQRVPANLTPDQLATVEQALAIMKASEQPLALPSPSDVVEQAVELKTEDIG